MLSRLFMLDMKNTLDNKKSQNNRQVKRKERKKRVNKNRSSIQKKHTHNLAKQKATIFMYHREIGHTKMKKYSCCSKPLYNFLSLH